MRFRWRFRRGQARAADTQPGGDAQAGGGGKFLPVVAAALGVCALAVVAAGWWWSYEPAAFDPVAAAAADAREAGVEPVTGFTTAVTAAALAETLLEKRGGYLGNDVLPPGVYLDNTPSWEFGVLTHLRVIGRALRNEFSRSQSQSAEDPDLAAAEVRFHISSTSWIFPQSESEYRSGTRHLRAYALRLADHRAQDTQFFARADNLTHWLDEVESRLGAMSLRLSESVGKQQLNLDLVGEPAARRATDAPADVGTKTSWFQIDNVFFEARGQAWALIHLLKAAEHDFAAVLDDKNARVGLRQIIRELEATQAPVWSPVILNGGGFGFLANHSLVMASYISRANAALIRLRELLNRG